MSDAWPLTEADLLPLSIGAALLGTGGGGNPYIGMLRARELIRKGAVVNVLPLGALPDEAWVGEVGGIGAPVVGIEKIEEGGEWLFHEPQPYSQSDGVDLRLWPLHPLPKRLLQRFG